MTARARAWSIGAGILVVAVAFCWAVVTLGQARAGGWIVSLVGSARAQGSPALSETLFSLFIFAPLIAAAFVGGALEKRNVAAMGVAPSRNLSLGLALGVGGLSLAVVYAWIAGGLQAGGDVGASVSTLVWGLIVIGFQTAAEEVYFRGWLQPALARRWGETPGIVAAALAFAALHIAGGARAPLSLVNLLLGGLVFGLLAARNGGLAAAIGVHWGWNAAEQLGWGLDPNPGLGSFGALVDKELVGAALWGGSGDGLNGSLGMTLALVAILLPLIAGRGSAAARVVSPTGSPG